MMAFSGSLRHAASGIQSYLDFCKFGLSAPGLNFLNTPGDLFGKSDSSGVRNRRFRARSKVSRKRHFLNRISNNFRKIGTLRHGPFPWVVF